MYLAKGNEHIGLSLNQISNLGDNVLIYQHYCDNSPTNLSEYGSNIWMGELGRFVWQIYVYGRINQGFIELILPRQDRVLQLEIGDCDRLCYKVRVQSHNYRTCYGSYMVLYIFLQIYPPTYIYIHSVTTNKYTNK